MFKNKKLILILCIAIFNATGLTIVIPLFPFLLGHYVSIEKIAFYLGTLISVYAVCKFIMTPIMGSISDYFGRKPILLISLFGTAIGYFILGIANALWMLFIGRIIDGICAGDISTLYAYIADSTQGKERTKFYGYLGAANGIGFMLGPAIGGLLGNKYIALPFFVAASMSIITAMLVYFLLPETLIKIKRSQHLSFRSFNFLSHFKEILALKTARIILITGAFFFHRPCFLSKQYFSIFKECF